MKKHLTILFILFILLLQSASLLYSQKKTELSAGAGMPELIFMRIAYGEKFQPGFSAGYFPKIHPYNPNLLALSGDLSFHFPANPKNTKGNTWYLKGALTFLNTMESYGNEWDGYLTARLGRTFFFRNNNGINLDIGIGSSSQWLSSMFSVGRISPDDSFLFPSVSLSYFMKL
jgi:hypothetical protein